MSPWSVPMSSPPWAEPAARPPSSMGAARTTGAAAVVAVGGVGGADDVVVVSGIVETAAGATVAARAASGPERTRSSARLRSPAVDGDRHMRALVRVDAGSSPSSCAPSRRACRGPWSACLIAARCLRVHASFEPGHGETRRQAPRSEAKPRTRPADGSGALPPGSPDGTNTPHHRGGHSIRRIGARLTTNQAALVASRA